LKRPAIFLRVAGLFFLMSFTYQYGANPPIDYPRLLISDTVQNDANGNRIYAFEDAEINAATQIEQNVWLSAQFYSGTMGQAAQANPPVSYRRVAATLLDSLSANMARLQIISQILDVRVNAAAAAAMQKQAAYLRQVEDESGAFVIIEQVNDEWSFRDRFWKTIQRQSASF
jgi:hypothetical protein